MEFLWNIILLPSRKNGKNIGEKIILSKPFQNLLTKNIMYCKFFPILRVK